MKKTALIASSLFALPFLASAQTGGGNLSNILNLVGSVGQIVQYIIPILVGCAIAFFFYGLIGYIRHPDLKEGKNTMIAGIVSLFIMVSLWGIITFAQVALLGNGSNGGTLVPPKFGGQ